MNDNPIVVFVVPGSVGILPDLFPIGWTASDGDRQLNIGGDPTANYSIIFLNDDCYLADNINFGNKDKHKALLLITHSHSKLNKAPDILKHRILEGWGKPIPCTSYSREPKFPQWTDIKSLLNSELTVHQFQEKYRNQHKLDVYDRLIMLCEIKVFNPEYIGPEGKEEGWADTWQRTIGELPGVFEDELGESENDYMDKIDKLRSYAHALSSKPG